MIRRSPYLVILRISLGGGLDLEALFIAKLASAELVHRRIHREVLLREERLEDYEVDEDHGRRSEDDLHSQVVSTES